MDVFINTIQERVASHVIIVQAKHGTTAAGVYNFIACLNNMKVLFQWIKTEGGICYLQTGGAPIVLDHYQKIFRAFNKQKNIAFSIRNGEHIEHFTATRIPIIKKL